jgi:hypothetical protein
MAPKEKARRIAPLFDQIEERYQRGKAIRGLGNGTAHLHLVFWRSDLPHRWVLVCEPRRNDILCGTPRCIPLSWSQPLFRPRRDAGTGSGTARTG